MVKRIKKQSKKEGRSDAAFIRRVLDRYLLEQEFRGGAKDSVAVAAQETINQNRELLEKLRNT
jgi:predicted DNA-binding protein